MMFIELNDGRQINLTHISTIDIDGSDIVYNPAKGSLDGIREHFETEKEAQERFEQLQSDLVN